jgi:hypothetical protein
VRLRGVVISAVAIGLWAYRFWYFGTLARYPYGYEVGSVAGRLPLHIQVVTLLALVVTACGSVALIVDFIRWRRKRPAS